MEPAAALSLAISTMERTVRLQQLAPLLAPLAKPRLPAVFPASQDTISVLIVVFLADRPLPAAKHARTPLTAPFAIAAQAQPAALLVPLCSTTTAH